MKRFGGVFAALLILFAMPGLAADLAFPPLSGRVVDAANLLSPADEAGLSSRLEALEKESGHQLVVATVPGLQGREIEQYGYQLGRAWGIGQKGANDGVILLVAPKERKVRIEVGYGLEGVLTDALASVIVNQAILPRFRAGDLPGGVNAGADALIAQLKLPPDQAAARVKQAAARPKQDNGVTGGVSGGVIVFFMILAFIVLRMFRGPRGRSFRRGVAPVVLWGPGFGGGGGGWGGGGDGGGFSGGGGSFGGGGASGGW